MSLTLKDISLFPQVIQDLIGMFNAEHRNQMKPVLRDLEWIECDCCEVALPLKEAVVPKDHWGLKYCSQFCFDSNYYDLSKSMAKVLNARKQTCNRQL